MVDWQTSLLSAFLQVLFDRAARREVINFLTDNLDDKQLKELKVLLLSAHVVLSDAEEKQFVNPHVREWLDMLKDVAYDADDVLVKIARNSEEKKKDKPLLDKTLDNVKDTVRALNPFVEKIKSRVGTIILTLRFLVDQKDLLSLREGISFPSSLPTTSLLNNDRVYGRDDDATKMKKFLLPQDVANEDKVRVLAIVGMAGIGKTTLARLLYNDEDVRAHFQKRIWAYISGGLNVLETIKKIHESITGFHSNVTDLDVLMCKIKTRLTGRKFLLVLDDLWDENFLDWDILRRPFESGDLGSRIIITTRSLTVASTVRADQVLPLSSLENDESWELFKSHAFACADPDSKHPILSRIGQKIAERCGGLPLALKTIGSLLYSQENVEEWDKILKSKIWELPNDKSGIFPALRLSYSHLPLLLKRCFTYCSIIPKGCGIKKQNLIYLWMAEDILPDPDSTDKRREDVGEECFQELLSRSFLQPDLTDSTKFVMHDLVNELAQYVAGKFFCKLEDINSSKITVKPRHVSYKQSHHDNPQKFEPLQVYNQHLRTFLPFKTELFQPMLDKFVLTKVKRLRVLSLSYYKIIKVPRDSIKEMKYLRYLDLSGTLIKEVPDSVVNLSNLETLLLSDCVELTELPKRMFKLTNLRHLDLKGSTKIKEMPKRFGELKSLQVLTNFVVAQRNGNSIRELAGLTQLHGSLSITKLQNVVNPLDASEAKLKSMEFLGDLELEWTEADNLQDPNPVLDKLQPHKNLERLGINGFGGTELPSWLANKTFTRMVFLCLADCHRCSFLPALGNLPFLKELHIKKMKELKKVGPEFFGTATRPFRYLETLKFEDLPKWEEWSWSPTTLNQVLEFTSLQQLHIHECDKLNDSFNQPPLCNVSACRSC